MANKLTKNDRLLSKSEKHDVAVAAFEALLKQHGAHRAYFNAWELQHEYKGSANVFYAWKEWARMKNPIVWIQTAFVWSGTEKGFQFWYDMHITWIRNYRKNFKK